MSLSPASRFRNSSLGLATIIFVLLVCVVMAISTAATVDGAAPAEHGGSTPIFATTGTLETGQTIAPSFSATEMVIFSLELSSGGGPVDLTLSDAGGTLWNGVVSSGEKSWGTATLAGNTTFTLENLGNAIDFDFALYSLQSAPFSWSGRSEATGLQSVIDFDFDQAGLYAFDFTVSTGERFTFSVNDTLIRKVISSAGTETFFIPQGVHTLKIEQDPAGGDISWSADISFTGSSNDTLPFSRSGSDVYATETIPFNPATAVQANLVFSATNATAELAIYDFNDVQIGTTRTILPDETVWQSYDFPAGANYIEVTAVGGSLDYDLVVDVIPAADGLTLAGWADGSGENSVARINFAEAGLYQFDYGVDAGRYQFEINDEFIRKTAEETGSVTYYIDQGIHYFYLVQDSSVGADWQMTISRASGNSDSLPYAKSGGELGGVGNDFDDEWLPLFVANAMDVNLFIEATGNVADAITLDVYAGSSITPTFTVNQVMGSEELWQTLPLAAGLNRLHIQATGNSNVSDYDLILSAVPTAGVVNWQGNALPTGEHSTIKLNFPTSGLYRFTLASNEGFANLRPVLATIESGLVAPGTVISNSYDLEIPAGVHDVVVMQDASYPETTWAATVEPVPDGPIFMTIDASLDSGESITQMFSGDMDFNVMVTTIGGDVAVDISDGTATSVWSETVIEDEISWGTGTLAGDNQVEVTNLAGGSIDVAITFYHIAAAASYSWDGNADANGLNSEVRLNFPADGLYTFTFGADTGRYQFLVDSEHIQKTVEGSDSLTAFVSAGVHSLHIIQDSAAGADWDVAISDVGPANDSLPYLAAGGDIGANDFTEEWLPIELTTATTVNIEMMAVGAPADALALEIYDSVGLVESLAPILGGESLWISVDLPAQSWLRILADGGNGAALSYALSIDNLPTAGTSVAGLSIGDNAENSSMQVIFPSSGLYTFDLDAVSGQFQFEVATENILKTVTDTTSVTYYVPAGTHKISVYQDATPAEVTEWSATISNVGASNDSLPFQQTGGAIGTDFTEEWLPVHLGTDSLVNMRVNVYGASSDSIDVAISDGVSTIASITVQGDEILWQGLELPASAFVHLDASASASDVDYEVVIEPIGMPTYNLAGYSQLSGEQPTFLVEMAVAGTYQIVVTSHEGFINFSHSEYPVRAGIVVTSEVYLEAEVYEFVGNQSGSVNDWEFEISLLLAEAPQITDISPAEIFVNTGGDVVITGDFFWVDEVELVDGSDRYTLTVNSWNATTIEATIPDSVPVGVYDVVVTNQDAQSDELSDSFLIKLYRMFIPIVSN